MTESYTKSSLPTSEGAAGESSVREVVTPPGVSPAALLNTAYIELLDWQKDYVFPEVSSN